MKFDRRTVLKTAGAALGGATLGSGVSAGASTWNYELAGQALDAGTTEVVVQGDFAYVANLTSISIVDVSDRNAPLLAGTALGTGEQNQDVKVSGDVAGLANDGAEPGQEDRAVNPGGVTFFDVSDPTLPEKLSFYPAADGIHNHFVDGDYAYLCVNDDFDHARMVILDISDPTDPVSLEGEERGSGGAWMLRDAHEDMAEGGLSPIHDVYVQDDLAYMAFWDSGVVVADVSDPTDPRAVAHFGAVPSATTSFNENDYLGSPGNAHYVQPTPDGNLTLVGAETFPGPFEDTVIQGHHGGIRIFDTSDVSKSSTPSDPFEEEIGFIPAPDRPTDAIRTSHNFDVTDSKVFTSWYQGGLRAFSIEDPTDPEELAAFAPPGTAYWAAVDLPTSGPKHYTVGSDIGAGLTVLELNHETPGEQSWETDDDLGPRDVLSRTMEEPL